MVYNIHIQTNRIVESYVISVTNPLSNEVVKDEPYDKLSKRFNRYTHKIKYLKKYYDYKDYNLCLDNPNVWFYRKFFYLYNPKNKILSVDIFFQSNDGSRIYPLIFGFNEASNSYYYTYYFLRGKGSSTRTITDRRWIEKDDLLTRLLEEYGLHERTRYNKFVITLDKRPTNSSPIEYPKSGHNTKRITVTKKEVSQLDDFVKYEHKINELNNVEAFYISFKNNSLYLFGGPGKLENVEVYYKQNEDIPIIIIFGFKSGKKLYKCSEFISHLPSQNKSLSKLPDFSEQNIKNILEDEFAKLKQIELKDRDLIRKFKESETEKKTPSNPKPTQSRQSSSTAVTSGPTDVGSSRHTASRSPDLSAQGPPNVVLSPPSPISTTDPRTSQRDQDSRQNTPKDTDAPSPPVATPPILPPATIGEHSPAGTTEQTGEMGKGPHIPPSPNKESTGERSNQETDNLLGHTTGDNRHSGSDSRTMDGQASPQVGGEKSKVYDTGDLSTKGKIVVGVAGTAIGTGAIGGLSYYISAVLSVIQWLI